jgi:antitoxin ParD1/3/4/toxin ParE1/3/4
VSDYILGSDAVLDLEDIWDYIATDSIDAADRWIAKLFDAFEGIVRMPGIGHRREDLTPYAVLFWTVGHI